MKRIFIENAYETNLILCTVNNDESIAKAITLGSVVKFKKEDYEYWGYDETNPMVKASVYRPVTNDDKLWIDTISDKVFQLQGLVTDIHNNFIPNVYRFRYVGKLVNMDLHLYKKLKARH